MEHHIIYSTWNNTEGRAPYNLFLNSKTRSQGLLHQRVPLDLAKSDAETSGTAPARAHSLTLSTRLIFMPVKRNEVAALREPYTLFGSPDVDPESRARVSVLQGLA